MNVSDSKTPAELEPEPDSPVPIPSAVARTSVSGRTNVNNVNSLGCSEITRNGEALRTLRRMEAMALSLLDRAIPQRDPVIGTQQQFL